MSTHHMTLCPVRGKSYNTSNILGLSGFDHWIYCFKVHTLTIKPIERSLHVKMRWVKLDSHINIFLSFLGVSFISI